MHRPAELLPFLVEPMALLAVLLCASIAYQPRGFAAGRGAAAPGTTAPRHAAVAMLMCVEQVLVLLKEKNGTETSSAWQQLQLLLSLAVLATLVVLPLLRPHFYERHVTPIRLVARVAWFSQVRATWGLRCRAGRGVTGASLHAPPALWSDVRCRHCSCCRAQPYMQQPWGIPDALKVGWCRAGGGQAGPPPHLPVSGAAPACHTRPLALQNPPNASRVSLVGLLADVFSITLGSRTLGMLNAGVMFSVPMLPGLAAMCFAVWVSAGAAV